MKKTLIGLLLVVAAMATTACVSRYERDMQIAASQAQQARYESQAAAAQASAAQAQAQARADAQAAMAASQAEYKIAQEVEKTKRDTALIQVLPWIVLILVVGIVAVGYWWLFLRAKVRVVEIRALLPAPPSMVLPPERRIPASVQRRGQWHTAAAVRRVLAAGGCRRDGGRGDGAA